MNWKRLLLIFSVSTVAGVVEDCVAVFVVTGSVQLTFSQFAVILSISLASSALLECLLQRMSPRQPDS